MTDITDSLRRITGGTAVVGVTREAAAEINRLRFALAARDAQPAPTDDEREALILIARDVHLYDSKPTQALSGKAARRIADAAFAAGYRRQPSAPSGMTREALAEMREWLSAFDRYEDESAHELAEAVRRFLAAFPAVGQEPAAVRLLDRVTDECWCSDSAQEYGLTDAGCPRHEAALAHRPEGHNKGEADR